MTTYTVQAGYATFLSATVSVEAETPEEACAAAIGEADEGEYWKTIDHVGDPFVWAICEGADRDPWNGPVSALPIHDKFAEHGPPPLVTLGADCPHGSLEVTRGTVRVRFVDPAATVITELSDAPPPPENKPVVIVRPRPDGAPDVLVVGGKAIVRVEGWQHRQQSDEAV